IGCDLRFSCRPSPRRVAGAYFFAALPQPTARTRRATPAARRDAASAPLPTLAPLVKCAALRNANDGHESHFGGSPAPRPLRAGAPPGPARRPPALFPAGRVGPLVPCAAGAPPAGGAPPFAVPLAGRGGGRSGVIETRRGAAPIGAPAPPARAPADGYTMLV